MSEPQASTEADINTNESNTASQDVTRRNVIREMLGDSTARNPTSILGTVLADFTAQGKTELSVYQGEEIFILYEINDWAFVTAISDSRRRGYVPLDYCDLVKDFYSFNPAVSTWQVVEYQKPSPKKTTPKPRARRVLFADEVQQQHHPNNGYSTQSLPRNWGKSKDPPKPQVRWRNGFFYLQSPSPQDTNPKPTTQHSNISKQSDPRIKYNSLPNMRNGLTSETPRKARNAFYSINATEEQSEKQRLRLASIQLYGSMSNQVDQQRKPVERSLSLNQLREQPTIAKTINVGPSILRAPTKSSTNQWQSLETLHEANEADDSPTNTVQVLTGQRRRRSENDSERVEGKREARLQRSSSLNTPYAGVNATNSSEKEKTIQRLIKRFQKKLLEANVIDFEKERPENEEPATGQNTQIPHLNIIPATPENNMATELKEMLLKETQHKSLNKEDENKVTEGTESGDTNTQIPAQENDRTSEHGEMKSSEMDKITATTTSESTMAHQQTQSDIKEHAGPDQTTTTNLPHTHNTCCCCHHHHHHHGHHQPPGGYIDGGNYLHMLQYISTPPPPTLNSSGNDHHSESGLGDTESIHSAGELQRQNSQANSTTETRNFSDGATQTTGSLEDLKTAGTVERKNQTSPEGDGISPFQRNSRIRQSQKNSPTPPIVIPVTDRSENGNSKLRQESTNPLHSKQPAEHNPELKQRVDNSKTPDCIPSTHGRHSKLNDEVYSKLQVSSVETDYNMNQHLSNNKLRKNGEERYDMNRCNGADWEERGTTHKSEHEAHEPEQPKSGNMKTWQAERRLSLPSGVQHSALSDHLTRTQSFSTGKQRQMKITGSDETGDSKLNYTTVNDLTVLGRDGEPGLEVKKKTKRREFYDKHDARLAEINQNHTDPWQKWNNQKQTSATKKKSPLQRQRNTLNGIKEQYIKIEQAKRIHENLRSHNGPEGKQNSSPSIRQNSINRWLDSIDLKETDFDASSGVIESDEEEIII